jgi:hypothetical protein
VASVVPPAATGRSALSSGGGRRDNPLRLPNSTTAVIKTVVRMPASSAPNSRRMRIALRPQIARGSSTSSSSTQKSFGESNYRSRKAMSVSTMSPCGCPCPPLGWLDTKRNGAKITPSGDVANVTRLPR